MFQAISLTLVLENGFSFCSSDQTYTPNTVVENKKKKERRKDKDNCQVETSEDETVDIIGKLFF